MEKLTDKNYWNNFWRTGKSGSGSKLWQGTVLLGKKIMGEKWKNYSEYVLWNGIYKRYLPPAKGLKILEIGSAPGWNLINFYRYLGYEPFGIEYSSVGIEENKKRFLAEGLPPENIVSGDFFSDNFLSNNRGKFDLVMSGGFIEHFDNPTEVVSKQLLLLKQNGLLIATIPNLAGFNRQMAIFFNKDIFKTHNSSIMDKEKFLNIFKSFNLETVYCGYFGTLYLSLYSFDYKNNSRLKLVIFKFLSYFQIILNYLLHIFLRAGGWESKNFSPYLIYIGKKL